jgi:hypothetical protein
MAKKGSGRGRAAKKAKPARARTSAKKMASKVTTPSAVAEQASRIVKEAAAKQRIVISLTEEQFEELARNLRPDGNGTFDPRRPFQIDFEAGTRVKSRLPVASCAFWSDSCCV